MDDDLVLVADLLVDEELPDVRALVARELQNLPELVVCNHCPVALEGLLQRAKDLVQVQVVREALDGREALPTATRVRRQDCEERLTFSAAFGRGSCPGRGRWSC